MSLVLKQPGELRPRPQSGSPTRSTQLTPSVDVFLSACKLGSTYRALNARAAALQTKGEVGEVEGYSLTDKKDGEEATKLAADFKAWKSAAWVNLWVSDDGADDELPKGGRRRRGPKEVEGLSRDWP